MTAAITAGSLQAMAEQTTHMTFLSIPLTQEGISIYSQVLTIGSGDLQAAEGHERSGGCSPPRDSSRSMGYGGVDALKDYLRVAASTAAGY